MAARARLMRDRGAALWVAAAVVCVALAAGALAWRAALADIDERLYQSLILTLRSLETEIDRFRYLPKVTGEDARIRAAIQLPFDPAAIAAANRYLERVTELAGASHLYLMDAEGLTLAASNWQLDESFVGQNYSFRPYFKQALETGAGGFYAIGVTTKTPGYFLSARIEAPGGVVGVVVVKVDLVPLQRAWEAAGQATAVADADGVVFLSGVTEWLYRPLKPLADEALSRLAAQRTYLEADLAGATPLLEGSAGWMRDGSGRRLRAGLVPFETDWQVVSAAPMRPALMAALGWGGAAALATALGLGLAKIQRQRRQLVTLRLRQSEMLEGQVAIRTQQLAQEIEARRDAEADLRAAQEGLVHSEKMAALGRMSAAIVHELSQPLAAMEAVLAAAGISIDAGAPPEKAATRIETARNLIRRMQRTTKHLKSFARKESGTLEEIDARAVAESALELVQPRARAVGILPVLESGGPLMVRAGRVRLEQVLVNLLLNALDAVEGQEGAEIALSLGVAGNKARIEVRDTGPGISAEDLPRVVEPFFSTKTKSEGLGLGLAISQAILSEFGGRLDISSRPGEGTVMAAILPRVAGETLQEIAS
ncbi:ATP-binding protein [Pseudothioclava arenosa]|uniref:histidine kinase n=1 Tax=Pseudothioclava arenosa TaxID=1795308 RepID=A0A2A4CQ33_9RHOB|nr:ATP-binding protein [Pseudothioclava arenosa]PCD76194.1 two-component sensor histidine kinase [Pseudothioclava arenosa]